MVFGIYLSQVWAEYRQLGVNGRDTPISITYRKAGGEFGEKHNITRRAGSDPSGEKKDLSSVEHEVKEAGKMRFTYNGQPFEIWIPLLLSWNGKKIDHRF